MSRRDWLYNFAIGLTLVPSILLLLVLSSPQDQSQQQSQQRHATQAQQSAGQDHPSLSGKGEDSIKPSWYHPSCAEKQSDKDADLCQQIRQAKAAEDAAYYARIQLGLGCAGALLVLVTIHYARRAAIAARDAATHAEAGAKAAIDGAKAANESAAEDRKANELLATNSELELRAYISVEPGGINQLIGAGGSVIGLVGVHNVGKLPARNVWVHVRMSLEPSREIDLSLIPKRGATNRVIQPGVTMIQGSSDLIGTSDIAAGASHQFQVFVWGMVQYEDGYGNPKFTRFCHRYAAASYNRNEDWNRKTGVTRVMIGPDKARYHTEGNDAN